jgi:alpha-D-xyloside xylohydrolase
MLVVDYMNQAVDGDFAPNPACYPSLSALTSSVRALINASVVFSIWPEVAQNSTQRAAFAAAGCLGNSDLGGSVLDTTIPACRDMIWALLLPHYYEQGVSAYWLDETDGEGTAGGDGEHGYDTSFGPAAAYSQLWVGSWIQTFTERVAELGEVAPLALTRGAWAGAARHGIVLWSSDIESTFETLAAMVPQGVHASMSGIPWWATDVGGRVALPPLLRARLASAPDHTPCSPTPASQPSRASLGGAFGRALLARALPTPPPLYFISTVNKSENSAAASQGEPSRRSTPGGALAL